MRTLLLPAAMMVLTAVPLYAAHPLITDDTGTQGTGHVQIELNAECTENDEGSIEERGGRVDAVISYGLSDRVDLVVGIPWMWYDIEDGGMSLGRDDGQGDLAVELKWRFFEYEDHGLSMAIKPSVCFPAGDDDKGFGNGKVTGGGTLIVSKEGVLGQMHANVGYTRSEYGFEGAAESMQSDIWHASFAAGINLTADMLLVGNIGVETAAEKGAAEDPAFFTGGLIYSLTDDVDIDAGVRWGLNAEESDRACLAGIAARW